MHIKRSLLQTSASLAAMVSLAGCALYSQVSVSPLRLKPGDVTPPASSISDLVAKGDYARAIAWSPRVLEHPAPPRAEIVALGRAAARAGRPDTARRLLRRGLDMAPSRAEAGSIAWELSQSEFLDEQYPAALAWAEFALAHGVGVRPWFLGLLREMSDVDAYRLEGDGEVQLPMRSMRPAVPRIDVTINASTSSEAIIDSGAMLSIVSESLASRGDIRRLDTPPGIFYGLLNEPIEVQFGVLDSLQLGSLRLRNVPVAIMDDRKLNFFLPDAKTLQMDLLLGTNLLKEFRLELDYWRERVTFHYLTPSMKQFDAAPNLFFHDLRPVVHATIANRGWYLLLLDTGSEVSYLDEAELASTRLRNAPRVHSAVLQGLGGARKQGLKIEKITIGVDKWAGTFRDIPLYRSEKTGTLGIVGSDFLRNFRVVIDFGRMRVDLEREAFRDPYSALRERTQAAGVE